MGKSGTTASSSREPPWAIRGVSMEARNAARKASQRAGLTLGEWVDRTIWASAQQELKSGQALPTAPLEQTLAELVKQMQADREDRQRERDELAARISAVEAHTEAGSGNQPPSPGESFLARLYGLLRGKEPRS